MIMRYLLSTISLIICIAIFHSCSISITDWGKLKVTGGYISGITDSNVHIFKGIPFAAPPVDSLRWKAPQPVRPWDGVKSCTAFGPSPMQRAPQPFNVWSEEYLIPSQPISEDCLYLNVWTAAENKIEKRPVFVWIYGGGFQSGGSAVPIYDGKAMADQGLVFVSINYRVGLFGFFAHPELSKESASHVSGNYGLLDQVAALKWVRDNIAQFGGDPANVTIAGQSAGSMSVNCLVASPLAKGLFHHAIAESGAHFTGGYPGLGEAEELGVQKMAALGIPDIDSLRKAPASALLASGGIGPIVDGHFLPKQIYRIFENRGQNPVDLITGWNQEDALVFPPFKSAAEFKQQLQQLYGENAMKMLSYYPAGNDSIALRSQVAFSRDRHFGMQNFRWANVAAKQGTKVYLYRFARQLPYADETTNYGAFHTAEVPFVLGNLKFVNRPWTEQDFELSRKMSAYWVNFAKTGSPNAEGMLEWEPYDPGQPRVMWFDLDIAMLPLKDSAALQSMFTDF